ncbi:MAG TPA: PAS domain S-box protein [Desulfatiglandales bacterium]|nr:PAS domain S-box protein [Desulfatiglandales bacterium]
MDTLLTIFTIIRLLIIPLLLYFAFTSHPISFIIFFIATILIGFFDEILARKFNRFTSTRSRIGSWCDFISFFVIIVCAWILWPDLIRKEAIFLVFLMIGLFIPAIIGYLKYSRLTSYHTWTSRVATTLVGSGAILAFLGGPGWLFEFSTPLYIFARMEEVAITAILPEWEFNVPSLKTAIVIENKIAKEEMIKAEEKLREVLSNIEDGYYELDLKGNLTFFNPTLSKYLGYSEQELMGMNNRQIMSEDMAKKVYIVFNEVYRTGRPSFATDWEVLTKKGEIRYFETSVSLLRDSKGQPTGFRCIGRDITERERAEQAARIHQEQLYQASKMVALGTLVSGVAHEINNPNNFIMINTPILREAWEGILPILDEYYREHGDFTLAGMDYTVIRNKIPSLMSGIESGSNRILHIVQDLKNYVQKDSTGLNNDVDLNRVVDSALSLISNIIQKSTRRFSVNYGNDLPIIKGNFQRLEQIVINLVQNACQSLPDKEKAIRLTTGFDRERGCITLVVEDEGIGIPGKNLAYLTDPFFSTRQDLGGLGLGLSISRKIIEEHHGKMTFQSEEGKGTRVEVTMPIH